MKCHKKGESSDDKMLSMKWNWGDKQSAFSTLQVHCTIKETVLPSHKDCRRVDGWEDGKQEPEKMVEDNTFLYMVDSVEREKWEMFWRQNQVHSWCDTELPSVLIFLN